MQGTKVWSVPPDEPVHRVAAPTRRLTALDAVRGIAACVVVLWHCYLAIPDEQRSHIYASLWSIPLRPFYNGAVSVIIFFVLSGYVLAIPFFRARQLSYPRYLVKRFCRLYLPFVVSICVAALLYLITNRQAVAGATLLNKMWPLAWPGFPVLAGHFLMFGTEPHMTLNSVMWSLVYEMRVSVIFPLLIILCRDTRIAVVIGALLLFACTKGLVALGETGPWAVKSFWVTVLWTARIVPYFLCGILLNKHSEQIRHVLAHIPWRVRPALIAVPIIIFMTEADKPFYLSARNDTLYVLGAAMVIVLAIEIPKLRVMLEGAVTQWLGRISYSVYLIHLPILLMIFHVMLGHAPVWFIVLAAIVASLATATLMHTLVEVPAIRLGRQFA